MPRGLAASMPAGQESRVWGSVYCWEKVLLVKPQRCVARDKKNVRPTDGPAIGQNLFFPALAVALAAATRRSRHREPNRDAVLVTRGIPRGCADRVSPCRHLAQVPAARNAAGP